MISSSFPSFCYCMHNNICCTGDRDVYSWRYFDFDWFTIPQVERFARIAGARFRTHEFDARENEQTPERTFVRRKHSFGEECSSEYKALHATPSKRERRERHTVEVRKRSNDQRKESKRISVTNTNAIINLFYFWLFKMKLLLAYWWDFSD